MKEMIEEYEKELKEKEAIKKEEFLKKYEQNRE